MLQTILVAIDGSDAATCAVKKTAELAQQLGARVVLVHVLNPDSVVVAPELMQVYAPTLAEMKSNGETLVRQALTMLPANVEVEPLILEGNPAHTIVDAAVEHGADLVIIGTDSRGRLAHFLLGSTADGVIRRAPCPVMTVRQTAKETAHRNDQTAGTFEETTQSRRARLIETIASARN